MNVWRIDVTFKKESYVTQGHMDPLEELMRDIDNFLPTSLAEVEIQALISGPFSDTRIVSTVRLNCQQNMETVELAQGKATELAMEGLRNGWEVLQERIAKGHFPGASASR